MSDAAEKVAPAMSPRDVAERWQCSERHVRNLIRDGQLRAFRLGGKLVRIPREAIEEMDAVFRRHASPEIVSDPPPKPKKERKPLSPAVMNEAFSALLDEVFAPAQGEIVYADRFKRHDPIVYFITSDRFVKIGWTNCIGMRADTIDSASPYATELVLRLKGGREVESVLHRKFSAYRHRREWFRYEGDLRAWVEAKIAEGK